MQIHVSALGKHRTRRASDLYCHHYGRTERRELSISCLFEKEPATSLVHSGQDSTTLPLRYRCDRSRPRRGSVLTRRDTHGATVNPSTGELIWTPSAAGIYTFQASVSDGRGVVTTNLGSRCRDRSDGTGQRHSRTGTNPIESPLTLESPSLTKW